MYTSIKTYCDERIKDFDRIPAVRKVELEKISDYIRHKGEQHKPVRLVYICVHNSRRSHFAQIWAQLAASYYKLPYVHAYSGGTEVSAFHPNALAAFKRIGFGVRGEDVPNPHYQLHYSDKETPLVCFSKLYEDKHNPQQEFAAIMVCGEAETNCPFIPTAEFRISTSYEDPKAFDGTPLQDEQYDERCRQIAAEVMYVFGKVRE